MLSSTLHHCCCPHLHTKPFCPDSQIEDLHSTRALQPMLSSTLHHCCCPHLHCRNILHLQYLQKTRHQFHLLGMEVDIHLYVSKQVDLHMFGKNKPSHIQTVHSRLEYHYREHQDEHNTRQFSLYILQDCHHR